MFSLFSISYLVTTVSADPRGNAGIKNKWGNHPQNAPQGNYNAPQGNNNIWLQNKRNLPTHQRGEQTATEQNYTQGLGNGGLRGDAGNRNTGGERPTNAPHLPAMDSPDAAGSSYNLSQPVNQGGINGVMPGGPGPRSGHVADGRKQMKP